MSTTLIFWGLKLELGNSRIFKMIHPKKHTLTIHTSFTLQGCLRNFLPTSGSPVKGLGVNQWYLPPSKSNWEISFSKLLQHGVKLIWLVVSTPLKNISQNRNLPLVGVKLKNIWNHLSHTVDGRNPAPVEAGSLSHEIFHCYCWWFRNLANKLRLGRLSHYLECFYTSQVVSQIYSINSRELDGWNFPCLEY